MTAVSSPPKQEPTEQYLRPLECSATCRLRVDYLPHDNTFKLQTYEVRDNKVRIPYDYQVEHFYRRFRHGHKILHNEQLPTFTTPATDITLSIIQKVWRGALDVSDTAQQKMFELGTQAYLYDISLRRTAEFKDKLHRGEDLSTYAPAPIPGKKRRKPHQQIATDNAILCGNYAFFHKPGLGKTASAIGVLDHVATTTRTTANRPATVLVLCPKSVIYNWSQEIDEFTDLTTAQYSTLLLTGTAQQRTLQAITLLANPTPDVNIMIAGYQAAVGTPFLHGIQWDLVVLDESHNIADQATDRAQFCLNILRPNSRRRLVLTGTPYRNTPFDIYSQLEFLYPGASGFTSLKRFKDFYCIYETWSPNGPKKLLGMHSDRVPLLKERIARHSIEFTKEEVMKDLPRKVYDIHTCTLSKEQAIIYKKILNDLEAKFETYAGPAELTVNNHLTQMLRLAQVTSGYAMLDAPEPVISSTTTPVLPPSDGPIYRFDPNSKLETLLELLQDKDDDQKTLIWCAFKENVKQIHARLHLEGIESVIFHGGTSPQDRKAAVHKFNCDPNTKVFIGIAQAGGVGLNLVGYDVNNPTTSTTNCDHCIYYSQNWSAVDYEQSQDRGHRMTTRVPLRITRLVVPHSIDMEILARVEGKMAMAASLSDVRSILNRVRNPDV